MNPHAARYQQIDDCRSRAIAMMQSARGQQAIEGGYYTEMFGWLSAQLHAGNVPTGIPVRLLEEWRLIGAYRLERGRKRA